MNIIVGIMCALALGGGVFVWWIENGSHTKKDTSVENDIEVDDENNNQKENVDKLSAEAEEQKN